MMNNDKKGIDYICLGFPNLKKNKKHQVNVEKNTGLCKAKQKILSFAPLPPS